MRKCDGQRLYSITLQTHHDLVKEMLKFHFLMAHVNTPSRMCHLPFAWG